MLSLQATFVAIPSPAFVQLTLQYCNPTFSFPMFVNVTTEAIVRKGTLVRLSNKPEETL
jgi:hypothetical protein